MKLSNDYVPDAMIPKLKIYISCNGLGLGHVGRILSVAKVLNKRGDKVIFGTWGPGVEFAQKEGFFCYDLPAVDWKDRSDGSFDIGGTVARLPLIVLGIIRLFFRERGILKKEKPDVVISDGSIGHCTGRSLGIPAIYVDHQMDFPLSSKIIRNIVIQIHNFSVKMGRKVAVLDLEPPQNIYPYSVTDIERVVYTGPLVGSVPADYDDQKKIKEKLNVRGNLCVIMISGPKHSPFALEEKILAIEDELMKMKGWTFIIKAPGEHDDKQNIRYVRWIDDVYELIKASDVVVSRSGYTTVCDILAFFKKSILIPQPKQVEQEALAKHLKEKGIA
ncbi:MAG: hypothetical protein KAH93_04740, partial [Candidatus Aenigmarchaeota archaeon]|nr:hypothetical protein [Candidatus Aenigmarchaeota archaeon]